MRRPSDVTPLTGSWVKHHFNRISCRRIDELLPRSLPIPFVRFLNATVAPALEKRADEDDEADDQRLPARPVDSRGYEADTNAREGRRYRNHDNAQHAQATGSSTTAVPYATISLIV